MARHSARGAWGGTDRTDAGAFGGASVHPRRTFVGEYHQSGGQVVDPGLAAVADFVLLHGNGVDQPARIGEMVAASRAVPAYRGQPVVINEDDHFGFDQPQNHCLAAVAAGASWGYFDYRMEGEGHAQGYQSVPTDWTLNSDRKRGFFRLLKELSAGLDR